MALPTLVAAGLASLAEAYFAGSAAIAGADAVITGLAASAGVEGGAEVAGAFAARAGAFNLVSRGAGAVAGETLGGGAGAIADYVTGWGAAEGTAGTFARAGGVAGGRIGYFLAPSAEAIVGRLVLKGGPAAEKFIMKHFPKEYHEPLIGIVKHHPNHGDYDITEGAIIGVLASVAKNSDPVYFNNSTFAAKHRPSKRPRLA